MVLFCASTVVCLPSPYILGLHLWLVYNTQSRFALVNLPQFPSDKTPSSFYPPPFRLQPHHPAEPLTPPSIVEGYLQVDMVGTDRWRKQLTRIWKLLTLVLVACNYIGGYKNEGFIEVLAAKQSPENPDWFQVIVNNQL
ncbi:putative glucose-1-phosphate adenylyltransferase [Helianthus annuus]|nr:putative glucose-1-phosphate adenylyltransferase [Helianthus annuus]